MEDISPAAETPQSPGPLERQYFEGRNQFIEYYQPPRLGIIHLLAWMTVAAVLLSINLMLDQIRLQPGVFSENQQLVDKIQRSTYSIFQAAILVGGCVFWLDRFRSKPGRIHPGHWILAITSLSLPFMLALYILNSWIFRWSGPRLSNHINFNNLIFIFYALLSLLQSGAFAWGAWRLPEFLRWKGGLGILSLSQFGYALMFLVFALNAFSSLILSLSSHVIDFMHAVTYFQYFVALVLIVLMAIDFVQGRRRDWLHWLGASTPVASSLMMIAVDIVRRFFLQ